MNIILAASSVTSVIGLVMIYFAATNIEPEFVELSDITSEHIGKVVTSSGVIKSKNVHQDGHIFITISDGKKNLQVPVFSNLAQYFSENNFQTKMELKVTGVVDDYRNQMQIIPRKPDDLVLGS